MKIGGALTESTPVDTKTTIKDAVKDTEIREPQVHDRRSKVPLELRDAWVAFHALLAERFHWKRLRRGYRPGNDTLHDAAEELEKMFKKYMEAQK